MEEALQKEQHTYKEMANLVIKTAIDYNVSREESFIGDCLSLNSVGQDVLRQNMGSRAAFNRTVNISNDNENIKKRKKREYNDDILERNVKRPKIDISVIDVEFDTTYTPQTKESKAAYELLIKFIQQKFGAQV